MKVLSCPIPSPQRQFFTQNQLFLTSWLNRFSSSGDLRLIPQPVQSRAMQPVMGGTISANKVFNIPELLESILNEVSRIDVFVLQRVSKTFANTIQGSKRLQCKMYRASDAYAGMSPSDIEREIHQQFGETSKPCFSTFLDPEMKFSFMPFVRPSFHHSPSIMTFFYSSNEGFEMGWRGSRNIHTQGSWREIGLGIGHDVRHVYCDYYRSRLDGIQDLRVSLPAEATLGDLFDVLKRWREDIPGKIEQARAQCEENLRVDRMKKLNDFSWPVR